MLVHPAVRQLSVIGESDNMSIIKFNCQLTIDSNTKLPKTEEEWENFNTWLEKVIESALEESGIIQTAEIIIEET